MKNVHYWSTKGKKDHSRHENVTRSTLAIRLVHIMQVKKEKHELKTRKLRNTWQQEKSSENCKWHVTVAGKMRNGPEVSQMLLKKDRFKSSSKRQQKDASYNRKLTGKGKVQTLEITKK